VRYRNNVADIFPSRLIWFVNVVNVVTASRTDWRTFWVNSGCGKLKIKGDALVRPSTVQGPVVMYKQGPGDVSSVTGAHQ
jgi:hypothetical protein